MIFGGDLKAGVGDIRVVVALIVLAVLVVLALGNTLSYSKRLGEQSRADQLKKSRAQHNIAQ